MQQRKLNPNDELLVQVPDLSKPFEKFLKKIKPELANGIDAANKTGDKKFKCLCKALEDLVLIMETGNSKFEFILEKNAIADFKNKRDKKSRSSYRISFTKKMNSFFSDIAEKEISKIEEGFVEVGALFLEKFTSDKNITYTTELKTFQKELLRIARPVEMTLEEAGGWQNGYPS